MVVHMACFHPRAHTRPPLFFFFSFSFFSDSQEEMLQSWKYLAASVSDEQTWQTCASTHLQQRQIPQTQTDRRGGEAPEFGEGSTKPGAYIFTGVFPYFTSNPQMLLFVILILQVAIKILFNRCKVPIELAHFAVMKRSCDRRACERMRLIAWVFL